MKTKLFLLFFLLSQVTFSLLGGSSAADAMAEEAEEKAKSDNLKILMTNMKRDNEIKSMQTTISEIGEIVDQLSESVTSKALEFSDSVDRVVNARNSQGNVYSVKSGGEERLLKMRV